jgi:hypothetical protein
VGSQGSIVASKTDLAIKSPDDPTRRSGKTFFQRQTDALAQLQISLQDHAEDCGNDAQFCCYLDRLCTRLRSDVTALVSAKRGERRGEGVVVPLSSGHHRALCGRLWLMLGILDSACFRCPYNQVRDERKNYFFAMLILKNDLFVLPAEIPCPAGSRGRRRQ